jgi:uncharacterized protein
MFTRTPAGYRPDRRRPLTFILVGVAAVYLFLTALGTLWTDYLWFDSIGFGDVWQRRWGVSIALGVLGVAIAFAVLWVSLKLVDRASPRWQPFDLSEEEELIERFREWVEPRIRQVRLWVTGALALILGLAATAWRDEVFLFLNSRQFGIDDPIFGRDVGFYVFRLPLIEAIADWTFNLLVLSLVLVAVAHYFNGGIRISGRRLTSTRPAKIHLSVMLALIALIRAVSYRLDMFDLMLTHRASAQFFGPGYTDVMARMPALRLLILIALLAAVLFIVNIFRTGWTLALVAVGSWIVVAVAAATIYPAIIQRVTVLPDQVGREKPYIENNLQYTRAAWGIDHVDVQPFQAADDLTAESISSNALTVDNLRIWDPSVLPQTYKNFQELRTYYALGVVDTDRYLSEGVPKQVMLAVRELEELNLPRDDWQNQRLFYTHGFGAVVNEASYVDTGGQPRFLLKDVPPVAEVPGLELQEPRVYFGETYQAGRPVIVKTGDAPHEVDAPLQEEGTTYNEYDGDAGVGVGGFWARLAFAFRYRDLNLLISPEIRSDSRVLVERNVREIVEDVAPFLYSDTDPYPVILNGKILWVLDMYTASSTYPYSQPLTRDIVGRLARSSDISTGINYMRNSVKAVVDAYDGDVTFYLNDPTDPIAVAWDDAFPGLFKDVSEMPDGLVDHLRYPQDLFRLQTQIYSEYHVMSPNEFFNRNDAWSLADDPATISRGTSSGTELLKGDGTDPTSNAVRYRAEMLPYYLLTKLPGEQDLSYLLLQPFTPKDKKNMSAFLVADSTPGRYGRLVDFRMPQGALVDGTGQVGQRIEQDAEISQQFTLWDSIGSRVIKGDLLVVPIEDSLLYVQPVFLEAEGGGFPEFRRVIVVYADRVEWAETLDGALAKVFGVEEGGTSEPPSGSEGSTVDALLQQAADAFQSADDALAAGDLAGYQQWVEEARSLIQQAQDVLEGTAEAYAAAFG